jgi:hypothetical protein
MNAMVEQLKKRIKKLLGVFSARDQYRPERHYMRGPGPKSSAQAKPAAQRGNAAIRSKETRKRGAKKA